MLMETAAEFDIRDYLRAEMMPHFLCPGCGHGIALRALLWAIHDLRLDKDKLAVVSGIGCAGRLSAYIDANTFHVTHGRPLAYATGLALARPDLHVVVITGDGDCLAIGGNHLIHACRRNLKLTCLMLNNEVYGMTGGQVSPTTSESMLTTTTPLGNQEPHFDACALATAAGAGFVGREVTHHVPKLKELIKAGLEHPGFAFVEVLSDCTEIFGRKNDLGSSPEMVMRQKSQMRPSAYRDTVDTPFRPNDLPTGILAQQRAAGIRRRLPARGGGTQGSGVMGATRIELRLGGTGGQGLVLSGKMLADALAASGMCVAQSQTYEPTSRGGYCNADLVVSDRRGRLSHRHGARPIGLARSAGDQAIVAAAQAGRAGDCRYAALPGIAGRRLPPLSPAAQPHRFGRWAANGSPISSPLALWWRSAISAIANASSRPCARRRRAGSSTSIWMRLRLVMRSLPRLSRQPHYSSQAC